jgi:uncharacterized membrane-anchored protein YjiN (DUF445 family)
MREDRTSETPVVASDERDRLALLSRLAHDIHLLQMRRSAESLVVAARAARDAARRRRLRRMKAGATGLLLIALGTFVATYLFGGSSQSVLFVRAASEAAMVGGLADWFAVTALFRHPLGLHIPHTALIPSQKDALAETMGIFMTEEFLNPEVLRKHLDKADLIGRLGRWLADPKHATALSRDAAAVLAAFIEAAGPDPLANATIGVIRVDMGRRSYAAQAGEFMSIATSRRAHARVLNLLLKNIADWLRRDGGSLVATVKQVIEDNGPLAWLYITDAKTKRFILSAADRLDLMLNQPNDPLRDAVDRLLEMVSLELRADTPLARDIDRACQQVLEDDQTREWIGKLIAETLDALHESLTDDDSALLESLALVVGDWGRRITEDEAFRVRLDTFVERVLMPAVENHADEFTRLIVDTVVSWKPDEVVEKIELAVGRDLQFIRVNGTVVGALAGLGIHALSLLLP